VHIALGDTLTKLGLVQEANKVYARTVGLLQRAGRFDEATAILEKLIAASPDNYQARLQLAELYLKGGRNDAAIRAFEEALPTLRSQGRDDLFQRAAERLLYYQPENLPLCRELAVFHLRRGNVPQAMKLLQYCHKRDPQDVDTLRLLASHFESTGDTDKAVVVLHQMARVFDIRSDKSAAQEIWRRIIEIRPRDAEAAKALGAGEPLPPPPAAVTPHAATPSPPRRRPPPPPGSPPSPQRGFDPDEEPVSAVLEEVSAQVLEDDLVSAHDEPRDEEGLTREREPDAVEAAAAAAEEAEAEAEAEPEPAPPPVEPVRVLRRTGGPELPPLPDEPTAVQKIASEADIFLKFGLKDRAIGHLTGAIAQFTQSMILRDRLTAIHLNDENLPAAVRVMIEAVRVLLTAHPDHALRYVREALFLEEDNAVAKGLLATLEGRPAPIDVEGPEPAPTTVAPPAGMESMMSMPMDLDVDIDVASEPVRTFVVPPLGVSVVPIAGPKAPEPAAAPDSQKERAQAFDLPSFDEVEDGPPILSASMPPGSGRLVVPVSEAAAAPLVLEMDDQDFAFEVPLGQLPEDEFPEAEISHEGVGLDEFDEPGASGDVTTDELPTAEHMPEVPAASPPAPAAATPLPAPAARTPSPAPAAQPRPSPASVAARPARPQPAPAAVPTRAAPATPAARSPAPKPAVPVPAPVVRLSPVQEKALSQALEEIDFFYQQGLVDDARTLLEGLQQEFGNDTRVLAKQAQLAEAAATGGPLPAAAPADPLLDIDSAFDLLESGASGAHVMPEPSGDGKGASVVVAPADATMHFDLGVAYREMGVLDRAVDEFRLATQDAEREANCYALIGVCLVGLGKPKEAVEEFKRGLHARRKTEVDELELYYGLAEAYLAAGDAKEALFYLQAIKRKDPGFRDVAPKINALLSASRPGKRPHPRAGTPPVADESGSNIDEAFDDMFKGERH
jgi:tetratricopeptide (TPR) repeat protein